MCNPNTSPPSSHHTSNPIPILEKSPPEVTPKCIYFDFFSLTKDPEKETNDKLLNATINDDSSNFLSVSKPWSSLLPSSSITTSSSSTTITDIVVETRNLVSLSFPILLTNLILYSKSVLSMVFLGRIGDAELAAGALAIAFANISGHSVLSGLALGMEPLCSQAFGAQRRPKILSVTLQRCVIFLLCCSLPILFLWLHMTMMLQYLGQDPNISRLAQRYIIFTIPDLVTNSFLHPIKIYLRAQGITRPVTYASLAGAIFHVPISLLFLGKLKLGIVGVAAATSASNFIALLSLILYVWLAGLHKPTWTRPTKECLTSWGPLVKLAAPSCVSVCLEWWWYEIMIVMCGLLVSPSATVASMGVLIQTTGLIYNFPAALSNAVSARVGNELGACRPNKARLSAHLSIAWSVIMGFVAMLFAVSARHVWARMFTHDPEILSLTAAALPILGLCELGNCPQTVACGVVRGTARPTTAANVNLGAFYVVGMPVAVGLAFYLKVGFCGLWIGLLSAQICCAGLMLFVVGTTDWKDQAKRAHNLTQVSGPTVTEGLHEPLLGGDGQTKNNHLCECEDQKEQIIHIVVTSS